MNTDSRARRRRRGRCRRRPLPRTSHFVEMSNRFNVSICNTHTMTSVPMPAHAQDKRRSLSQPASPRRYDPIFTNRRDAPMHTPTPSSCPTATPICSTRRASGRTPSPRVTGDSAVGGAEALKPTSIWRKNREAFLASMDKKLEEVMGKFEAKSPLTPTGSTTSSTAASISKLNVAPLSRKKKARACRRWRRASCRSAGPSDTWPAPTPPPSRTHPSSLHPIHDTEPAAAAAG